MTLLTLCWPEFCPAPPGVFPQQSHPRWRTSQNPPGHTRPRTWGWSQDVMEILFWILNIYQLFMKLKTPSNLSQFLGLFPLQSSFDRGYLRTQFVKTIMLTNFSHIGLLQFDDKGVTTHLARLVYLPRNINLLLGFLFLSIFTWVRATAHRPHAHCLTSLGYLDKDYSDYFLSF